jgi:hypothetical protein
MTQAEYIIVKFGGINATARSLGIAVSTVQGWMERGSIPERRWKEILKAAEASRVELAPEDFTAHLRLQGAAA